jgi:cell division initiation protein
MRLTPLDIRKQEFKKAMRGLEPDEVYAFLATIADEYEAVLNDNKALRERLLELDDKVQEYRNMEKTLRDTLLTAERITVEAKDNARRKAELIVKQAELDADRGARDITANATRLRQEIQQLKRQRESYMARTKGLVESHLKFLQSAEEDFHEEEKMLEKDNAAESGSRSATAEDLAAKRSTALPKSAASFPRRDESLTTPSPATPSPKIDRPLPAGPPARSPAERPWPDMDATASSSPSFADAPAVPKREEARPFERHTVEIQREAPLSTPVVQSTPLRTAPEAPVATGTMDAKPEADLESNESSANEWSLERLKRDIMGRWRND